MAMFNLKEIRIMTMYRGAISALIYRKTLSGPSTSVDLKAVTLMSTDVDQTVNTLVALVEMSAHAIEIGVGIWLLWRQLGAVAIAPILVVVTCFLLQGYVASFAGPRQAVWVQAVQRRVGQTSSILRSMKSVKLAGLADSMIELLQSERIRELNLGSKFRWIIIWQNAISM